MAQLKEQEKMSINCTRGGPDYILEKKKISERVIRLWNKLFRKVVGSLSLGVFKRCIDVTLGDMGWLWWCWWCCRVLKGWAIIWLWRFLPKRILWFCKKKRRPIQDLNLYFSKYSSFNSQITYSNFRIFTPLQTQLIVLCILWMDGLACRMADWPLQKSSAWI